MTELGPIVIGAREIYDALLSLIGKVDLMSSRVADNARVLDAHERQLRELDGVPKDLADHEQRLRGLESSRWPRWAVSTLLTIGGLAVAALGVLLTVVYGK